MEDLRTLLAYFNDIFVYDFFNFTGLTVGITTSSVIKFGDDIDLFMYVDVGTNCSTEAGAEEFGTVLGNEVELLLDELKIFSILFRVGFREDTCPCFVGIGGLD